MKKNIQQTTASGGIQVINEQSLVRFSVKRVVLLIELVLKQEKMARRGISILIADDSRIAKLHKDFLHDATPTDVIAFGLPKDSPEARMGYLGDVIVSAQTAQRVAAGFSQTPTQELERYCVHGVLHLLGYDDRKSKDHTEMHAAQEKYLAAFKIKMMGR